MIAIYVTFMTQIVYSENQINFDEREIYDLFVCYLQEKNRKLISIICGGIVCEKGIEPIKHPHRVCIINQTPKGNSEEARNVRETL